MADVARFAGVSHQTVSRVLNDHPNVKSTTRDRVLQVIKELGYRPNVAARALVTRKSRTLGVISFNTTLYGPASMLYGIEQAAKDLDYFVMVAALSSLDRRAVLDAVDRLRDQAVEGLIVIAPQASAVRALGQVPSGVPLVAVGCGNHATVASAAVDNEAGAAQATSFLLDLGHRTVHHVAGPRLWLEAQDREAGWRRALLERGAPVVEPVYGGDWSARSGYALGSELVRRLHDETHPITAVFCANDHAALGLVRAFQQAGVRVPEDVSVVGFDDITEAQYYLPPLTTVRQDFDRVGRVAVEALVRQIETGEVVAVPPLEPELIVRGSTAPPPS